MKALLWSASDSLPRDLIKPLASCLYAIVGFVGAPSIAWVEKILSDSEFPSNRVGSLSESDKHMFLQLLFRDPPLQKRKFDAMIVDFANICRQEATGDVLVAYAI